MSTPHQEDDFRLTFEVAIIEHLGLNLYSEVDAAIGELIANAYDADAKKVLVTLPVLLPLGREGQQIVIDDDGHGMTYEECRDLYLRIGRNRRHHSRTSKSGKRKVIGKKGIGKLAGFGIADRVRIHTVAEGQRTDFELDLKDLRNAPLKGAESSEKTATREYHPLIFAQNVPTDEPSGTRVTLSGLRDGDPVDIEDFKTRLARRFAILGDRFQVELVEAGSRRKHVLKKFDLETQFRFPEKGWGKETIPTPGRGEVEVEYWFGFTKATIKNSTAKGVSVIANGKSIQDPFEFRLAGGATGQFGLQYLTGEVRADWLDEVNGSASDVVASDRASVRWNEPDAAELLKWGRGKLREILRKWVNLRGKIVVEEIREEDPEIQQQIDSYSGLAKEELQRVVARVASTISHVSTERARDVVRSIVVAYRHEHMQDILRKVADATDGVKLFAEALAEWNIINAVLTFQELMVKATAVHTLETLVQAGATEVKSKNGNLSLHEHLVVHPWLVDPMASRMESERNIEKFIAEEYGTKFVDGDEKKRFDFFAFYDASRVKVIEIKSATARLDLRSVRNLVEYRGRIKKAEDKREKSRRRKVETLLIYSGEVVEKAEYEWENLESQEDVTYMTWNELNRRNQTIYREMIERVRKRNPDDPRVKQLAETATTKFAELGLDS